MNDLPLETAQGQWAKNQNDNEWLIVNKDGVEISRLPACLKDFEAMRVIHFGRQFEKSAYEKGVEDGGRLRNQQLERSLIVLQVQNNELLQQLTFAQLHLQQFKKEGVS